MSRKEERREEREEVMVDIFCFLLFVGFGGFLVEKGRWGV